MRRWSSTAQTRQVMEAALKAAPGRCLLNSINLENGEEKARSILTLARDFNAACDRTDHR